MKMEQKAIFATRIGKLRNDKGMSQEELAAALNIDRGTIAKYETQNRIPSYEHLTAFSEYFNVSTDYLLGLNDNATTDMNLQAVCDYTGLSEDAITAFIENMDESIYMRSPDCYPEFRYRIVNELLLSDDFYYIIDYLVNLSICSTNSLFFYVLKSERPDLLDPEFIIDINNNECDVYRYKISKRMEKIIDLFDNSLKADNITRNDLINNNNIIKPFDVTDKDIDEHIKTWGSVKDNPLDTDKFYTREQVTNNAQHNPKEE